MTRDATAALVCVLLVACERAETAAADPPGQNAFSNQSAAEPHLPPDPALARTNARKQACLEDLLATTPPRLHTLVRALCSEWVDRKIPGLAFALVEPGEAPIHIELGVRCYTQPAPIELETRFRLGSITKPITAALALSLVATGKLEAETPASIIPHFESQAGLATPTLSDLLHHTSGLGEIDPEQLVDLEGAWLPALARSPAAGQPGSYHYSNSAYAVIGAMIETAQGQDYEAILRARAWPSFTSDAKHAERAACGHLDHDPDRHPILVGEDLDFMPGDPRWLNPAGGVLASAVELARWSLELGTAQLPGSARMLEAGALLPAQKGHVSRPDERYGAGLRSWALERGDRAYGHSGNNVAFAAELLLVPGQRAIVLLSNCGAGLPASLAAAEQLL